MEVQHLDKHLGEWIKYPWERGVSSDSLVGDEVLNSKYEFRYGLPLAKCIEIRDNYLILMTEVGIFKVRFWDEMKIVPSSKFTWGDKVREIERPEVQGAIDNIIWHDKDAEYKYFITINNKPKSRRYNYNELTALF